MAPDEPFELQIPADCYAAMLAQARAELPNECVGFLAGTIQNRIAIVSQFLPLRNALQSPTRFLTESTSLLAAYKAMRLSRTDVLAIYHSHPTSAPIPSATDLANNTYGNQTVWLIIGLQTDPPEVRGWWLDTNYRPATWSVIARDAVVLSPYQYQQIDEMPRAEVERNLASNDRSLIAKSLISIGLHNADWNWVTSCAMPFLQSRDETLVSAAIMAIAHTARRNRSIDKEIILPLLRTLEQDARYTGIAQDAIDDIAMYVK